MSTSEATAVVRIIDKDGDGTVDFGEFLDWWREYALENEFGKFDTDCSGELSPEEFQALLNHLGMVEMENYDDLFTDFDVDGSGGISFAELLEVCMLYVILMLYQDVLQCSVVVHWLRCTLSF